MKYTIAYYTMKRENVVLHIIVKTIVPEGYSLSEVLEFYQKGP